MPLLSVRNGSGKAIGRKILGAASAALLLPLLISSQDIPQGSARLEPATLTASLAHDGPPTDLTTTLTNAGTAPLAWRVGAIRDVPAETAPPVATGPVATAKVYARSNAARETAEGEIIVGLKEAPAAASAAPTQFLGGRGKVKKELARARRAARAARAPRPGRKLYLVSLEDKSKAGVQQAIDELRKDPRVAYAEPNYRVKAVGLPNDPEFGKLYGLHNLGQTQGAEDADIDAPEAWDTHTGGDNVVVGVIDTGIDYLHPDLAANIWVNPGEIPGNGRDDDGNGYVDDVHGYDFVNDDPDPMDDHFHGTHVAGTIAAAGNNGIGIAGVAWKAKVAALKFLDAGGFGNLDDAIEAVAYANAMNIPITNNSWGGGGFSQALKDVIDAAGERGFLFVAAAGNESNDNDAFPSYPASYESANILSVAATDHRDDLAGFSSFGATTVDLGAPGVDTYSCFPGGRYEFLSGTSMATPHVAGAAALLRSFNPQLGQAEIKAALLAGVDPVPSLAGRTLTGGRLNLAKALGGVSPPWLTMAPRGPGSLEPGASQVLTATVNPAGLVAGRHRGLVTLVTDDPVQPNRELEVVVDVSGCRSLAADPAALDFGPVWRTTAKRMAVVLRNACNDFTTVSAVESSHGEFSAAGTFPLRVPPFGAVTLEVAYAPAGLGGDSGTVTLRSDAADHPALSLSVRGSGVEPPAVAADPSRFELTLDPSEIARRTLTVSNPGGDALVVDLRAAVSRDASAAARKPDGAARIIPGVRAQGRPYLSASAAAAGKLRGDLKPAFRASAAGLRVLYLTTLLPTGGEDLFTQGLRGLGNVGSLEVLDGTQGTPNVEYLLGYDAVLVAAGAFWSDPALLGDALADYADRGGSLCLLTAAIASGGGYGLQGRIAGADYMPIDMQGPGPGGEAVVFEPHPVTAGVSLIQSFAPTDARSVRGRGISLGAFYGGNLVGAVNPDKPIVALNIFPSDFAWGGDVILMLGNTLDYLASASSWLRIEPGRAVIPPGGRFDFALEISSERLLAGEHRSAVEISHNAPSGDNPLAVPVILQVRPVSRLALSHAKHDFGGVLAGGRASVTVTLTNAGNRATTVSSIAAEGDFASALPAPFAVPPFSSLDVELVYAPKEEGGDIGVLAFRSDAADHPELAIALRGRGLPAPLAALAPARLAVALAHDAAPRDLVSVLSNAGRGVLHYQVTSVRDATPPPAVRRAAAVAAERIYRAANYDLPAVSGELIVGLKEGKDGLADAAVLAGRAQVKRALGRALAPRGKAAGAGGTPAWHLPRKLLLISLADPSRAGVLKAIEDLRRDAHVAYAEPNYRVKAVAVPDDPDFGLLWGLHNQGQTGGVADADVDAPEAWDVFTGADEAVVGVIDTGIDYLHPDLAANVWTNAGEIAANGLDDDGNGYVDDVHGYDFVNEDGDPMDDHYHGTHVAGTIAAVGNNGIGIAGVAWKAKVAGLKFLDAGGFGSTDDAIEAVAYAAAMGIPITNNSWGGGGFSQALKDVIDAAGARGHLFVAAAGNESNDNDTFPSYPASYESDNIVSVAATDHRDELAGFSSFGATTVDLGAPGVETYSLAPGAAYQYLSGTSMATPHVAGAAALLKGFNPSLGHAEIKAALLGSAQPVASLAGKTLTGGRLNVKDAFAGVSPPWLSVSPRDPGVLEPGASTSITATVDPAGLTAGEHRGIATLSTDDPAHPTLTLEVVATVSGCRSLAAGSAALDFGKVWLGATGRLAVVLTNACNDFTTVSAVESGHKAFVPAVAAPLVIPPFGTAVLEIVYTPDDLKADATTLTLRSDAGDHPVLKLTARGTGVKPPAIAVDPAQVALTLDPSRQSTFALKVANRGGADLLASLSVQPIRKAATGALAPKVAVLERKAGPRYGKFRPLPRPTRLYPLVRSAAADLRVLYLTTIWQGEEGGEGDLFARSVRALPQVGLLDVLDGATQVPNADHLKGYDMVIVSADSPWADALAVGDALADYVDDGGRVVLMTAAIASGGGFELLGRMGGPGYMPIEKAGPAFGSVATSFADHPITAGLSSIDCAIPTAAASVQGAALPLGRYENGSLLGAAHEEKAVVALNVFPADGAWGGDLILMLSNTLDYLASHASWVKVEPADLRVAPGKSASARLLFDTEKLEAGTYSAVLSVRHNAPAGANPMAVPVTLTVRARSCLEAAPVAVNFGKVWIGRRAGAVVTLANPCNRPTVVRSISVTGKTFATSAAAPLTLAPFSATAIEVGYTPDDIWPDLGALRIKSDAQGLGETWVVLAGLAVRPPAISVTPASLLATLDPGVEAERTLEIRNTGGDSLRVKVSARAAEGNPPPAGRAALIPGRTGSRALVGEARAPLPYTSPEKFRGRASGLRVLFLYGHFMPDSGSDGDTFTRGLRGLSNVGSVDRVDISAQTPNLEYLQAYDIVLVSSDGGLADPHLLGETLADHVDAGGKVVLLAAAWNRFFPFGLEGRFATPEYLPIERALTDWDAQAPVLVDHPINAGVSTFTSLLHMASRSSQGAGEPLGHYRNGALTGAYHSEKPIVALNFSPIDGFWGGDVLLLVGNTLDWLGAGIRWMHPAATALVVPPGQSRKLAVRFNTAQLAAGEFRGFLSLDHDAPAGPSPLEVPVTLTVRSRRCLALEPDTLDFGKARRGEAAARSFSLANGCNEATRVSAITSGDAAFAAQPGLPLEVPAYGTVRVAAVFAPATAGSRQSAFEIRSDAEDHAILRLPVSGVGLLPPAISVSPLSLSESVPAGGAVTRALTVSNSGGDDLLVDILIGSPGSDSGSLAKVRAAGSGRAWSRRDASAASFSKAKGRSDSVPKADGLRVLYLTTIVPDSALEDAFTRGLRSLPEVGSLEVLSGEFQTPDAGYLRAYDAVIVASNFPFADAAALGDALAGYVDAGGRVCLMTAAISDMDGPGIGGRIATPDYMPMTMEGPGAGGMVTQFEDHPINAGIVYLSSALPTASTSVQGGGLPLGRFQSGILLGAYHMSKPVVALNVFPADGAWRGDLIPMMGNVLRHLGEFGSFLRVSPRFLRVPAGGSAEARVTLDGSRLPAGIHAGSLTFSHNVPGAAPVVVSATLEVAGKRSLAVSPRALGFGDALLGEAASRGLDVSNTGNLPVTVTAERSGSGDFAFAGADFPLELAPGETVRLKATFAPTAHGPAEGEIAFAAAGAGEALRVSLSGRGVRPADLAAAPTPAPLRFTVAEGGQASGSLALANLGDEGLRYRLDVVAGAGDGDAGPDSRAAYGPSHHAPLVKGSLDTRVGKPIDLAAGGPDGFGHRWTDSRSPEGPAFAWTDIAATGRRLETVSGCDDCAEEVTLSFAFPFYRESGFGSAFVSSNGFVTFGAPSDAFGNHPIPSPSLPGHLVAALFQDLYPAGGGGIWFQDFGNRAVVQYAGVPDFHGTGTYDFQIVLFPDGTVDLLYRSLSGVRNTATVGIQDGSAADGLGVVYNADFLEDSLAVRIRTWVTVPDRSGALAGEEGKTLPVSLDSRGLAPGTHRATLNLTAGASRPLPPLEVPVEITVTPAPEAAETR